MSEENVELVRRFFDARNNRDLGAMTECLDPDAEFDLTESRSPYRGLYRGHAQIRENLQNVFEAWGEFEMNLEDPVEAGDAVVVSVRGAVRGRSSGIPWRGLGANLFTVRNGKITRYKLFQTRAEALEAAGLSE